jgi:amino acid adenylation domain-containing protein
VTVPALTEQERHRVLYEWNDTRADFPDVCVHELFEQQVVRDPDAVAVMWKGQHLTYGELNQRANQVAHHLRSRGVGPEVLVGVALERTPELVVALLGVWKAGGAYVPLDPTYPQQRLSFMVGDADVRVLLTAARCRHLFPSAKDKAVCLDSDWPVLARESTDNPRTMAGPANLAYVMYTSGSTGRPKGAMILHRGLANYLCWAVKAYGAEPGGSVPVHTSISFDLTVTSLFTPLMAGGRVELLPEDVGAQSLLTALRSAKNRTLVKITPAHLELLSQQLSRGEAHGMAKTLVIGGENLLAESLRLWREAAPATRLINEYGPTETVVGCCIYEVQAGDPTSGSVPIGRPIANTQLYVLDADLHPVPPGVVGELYVGGAGVARGYLNQPEMTRQRFLLDPFSGPGGARMYKTGDLARRREDGLLECLGRIDDQVKVRGYRIELGEIEATLAGHPDVRSCAVLAREDTPGDKQLVGYVVARDGASPAARELQAFLKERLPEYMAPAQFVVLDAFPLTPNGKIDRKGLPSPLQRAGAAAQPVVAPRPETEPARDQAEGAPRTPQLTDAERQQLLAASGAAAGDLPAAGEIESLLAGLPEIREAVVSVQSSGEGSTRLVAFVVYQPGEQLTTGEVRRHLRAHLPEYMIPGLVVELDALPRSLDGTVDRKALPDSSGGEATAREFVAPASASERIVAEAWEALLPGTRVGLHDNFFELGGHSLLSLRAVTAIEQRTGKHLDPRLMYFGNVEQIAASLESPAADQPK